MSAAALTKGFHTVVIDGRGVVAGPHRGSAKATARWLAAIGPLLTAVDSPISAAQVGHGFREGEKLLNAAVCGIRWTPDLRSLREKPGYYGWILHGFELYEALREEGLDAIECFPTAS